MSTLAGVDIGGTTTRVLVVHADGRESALEMKSSTWRNGSLFSDPDNAGRLLAAFAHLLDSESSIVVGAHGCDTLKQCAEFARMLSDRHGGPVRVVNDAELVVPAAGMEDGIAVVVGTGSIVVGTSKDGSEILVGGHGAILGDPGSAPALVRDSVRALLIGRDRGEPRDPLAGRLMDSFGTSDEVELAYAFSDPEDVAAWGAHASTIFAAAAEGSQLARKVIEDAAEALAASVALAVARGATGTAVVCAGGVVSSQPALFEALRSHIARLLPDFTVELLQVPPVRGAVALAQRLSANPRAAPLPAERRIPTS